MRIQIPLLFVCLVFTAGLTQADPPPVGETAYNPAEIASKIHAINQMEVRAGQLARQRGSTPQIRRYGDRLVRDHQLADRMVLDFAKDQGLALGTPIADSSEQAEMAQLQQEHHQMFDQHFLTMMDQGHTKAIQLLTQEQRRMPENSELRGLVTKLLPILKQHDQLAENLQKTSTVGG